MSELICSMEGCGKKITARGLCHTHYYKGLQENSPPCSIDGCDKPTKTRQMCAKHYTRWRRHGDPHKARKKYANADEAFEDLTKRVGQCLIWQGVQEKGRYGQLNAEGKTWYAHRYAWERVNGPIPDGMQIDHICHTPLCVEVSHLRLSTPAENSAYLSGPATDSKSGRRNVYRHRRGWQVQVNKSGKAHIFGTYSTIEEAAEVAAQARQALFGEFAGKG